MYNLSNPAPQNPNPKLVSERNILLEVKGALWGRATSFERGERVSCAMRVPKITMSSVPYIHAFCG